MFSVATQIFQHRFSYLVNWSWIKRILSFLIYLNFIFYLQTSSRFPIVLLANKKQSTHMWNHHHKYTEAFEQIFFNYLLVHVFKYRSRKVVEYFVIWNVLWRGRMWKTLFCIQTQLSLVISGKKRNNWPFPTLKFVEKYFWIKNNNSRIFFQKSELFWNFGSPLLYGFQIFNLN